MSVRWARHNGAWARDRASHLQWAAVGEVQKMNPLLAGWFVLR
jgi:hypothetical protein